MPHCPPTPRSIVANGTYFFPAGASLWPLSDQGSPCLTHSLVTEKREKQSKANGQSLRGNQRRKEETQTSHMTPAKGGGRQQWAGGERLGRGQLPTCDVDLHLARARADGVGGLTHVGPCQAIVDGPPEEEGSVLGLHALGERAIQPAGMGRQGRGLGLSGPEAASASPTCLQDSQPFC